LALIVIDMGEFVMTHLASCRGNCGTHSVVVYWRRRVGFPRESGVVVHDIG